MTKFRVIKKGALAPIWNPTVRPPPPWGPACRPPWCRGSCSGSSRWLRRSCRRSRRRRPQTHRPAVHAATLLDVYFSYRPRLFVISASLQSVVCIQYNMKLLLYSSQGIHLSCTACHLVFACTRPFICLVATHNLVAAWFGYQLQHLMILPFFCTQLVQPSWQFEVSQHSGALEGVSRYFFLKFQKKKYQFFSLIVWAYTKSRGSVALILSELLNILYFFNDILYFFKYIFIYFSDKWAEHHKKIKELLKHETFYRKFGVVLCPFKNY